ncbi:MAG TPA: DivIVA domain-containing protein [Candidatus Merdivicinus intestinigallinarum]|nr:DivIVA domain-containing protein [Candidatus Merdivicinus intestinigallinarum]
MSSKSSEKLFEKAAFGYRTEEVDRYIEQMNAQIRSLEAEKADMIGKMKILAEKINEYRQDEANLKDALLGAQKMGNAIVSEAKAKADRMVSDAKNRSERMLSEAQRAADEAVGGIRAQVEHEKLTMAKMQKEVSDFKAKLLSLYKVHLNALNSLPDMEEEYEAIYNTRVRPSYAQPEPPAPEQPLQESPQVAEPVQTEQPQVTAPQPMEPAAAAIKQPEPAAAQTEKGPAHGLSPEESTTVRFDKAGKAAPAPKEEEPPVTTVNRPAHKLSFEEKFGDLKFGKNNPAR